jgi:hypothetical protein
MVSALKKTMIFFIGIKENNDILKICINVVIIHKFEHTQSMNQITTTAQLYATLITPDLGEANT